MAKSKNKTALVLGATGLVGGHCLRLVLESGLYGQVLSVARRPAGITHERLKEIIINFDQLETRAKELKVDDVFCCLGTTIKQAGSRENFIKVDHDYPLAAARGALSGGAKRYFIVSAMGADSGSKIFYNRVKGSLEKDLEALKFEALHIFRPSLLLGNRKEFRLGEKAGSAFMRAMGFLMIGPMKKYRAIQAEAVACAMALHARGNDTGVVIHESDEMQKT